MSGTEDCLRLSVFTRDLPVTENQGKMAVMVWFHGWLLCFARLSSPAAAAAAGITSSCSPSDGDFATGDASEDMYDPSPILDDADSAGVVVVTVTSRVGPFGFLCLGTESVPGNMVKCLAV